MRCQWCGKEFQKVTSWQRYCSDLCRIQANRHNKRKEEKAHPDAMILRSFVCMHCDEMVNVTDPRITDTVFVLLGVKGCTGSIQKREKRHFRESFTVSIVVRRSSPMIRRIGEGFTAARSAAWRAIRCRELFQAEERNCIEKNLS